MTDKLSDFFKDIKDRLASPFFSSFIIAWLIMNWKVPVSLLWYDREQLDKAGAKSHFDFIWNYYNPKYFISLPLLSALAYCFLYPFFKYAILIVNARIRTWGSNWVFKASREAPVRVEQYMEQTEKNAKLKDRLSEVLKNASVHKEENERLTTKIKDLENQSKTNLDKYNGWANRQSIEILNSKYEVTFTDILGNQTVRLVAISGNTYDFYQNPTQYNTYTCDHFYYNAEKNSALMLLQSSGNRGTVVQVVNFKDRELRQFSGEMYFMDAAENAPGIASIRKDGLSLQGPVKVAYRAEQLILDMPNL